MYSDYVGVSMYTTLAFCSFVCLLSLIRIKSQIVCVIVTQPLHPFIHPLIPSSLHPFIDPLPQLPQDDHEFGKHYGRR
jgi:hypothetical protein